MASVVEHGLHGDAVAPLAAKVVSFYLDRKHGHPFDAEPTLIERWERGSKPWRLTDEYPAPLSPG